MGKLIVLEGLDGSGKSTQIERLKSRLAAAGKAVRYIKFPDYDDRSSTLIKMYLAGEFGSDAGAVNAYAASSFYAVDRYASFVRYWKDFYENGGVIVCDRYVSSNAVHQAAKLPGQDRDEYLNWLWDYEFNKIGIPRPDCLVYLDIPVDKSQALMEQRYGGDNAKKDIHERDTEYLERCREAALYVAEKERWLVINCLDRQDNLRSIEDIEAAVWDAVNAVL